MAEKSQPNPITCVLDAILEGLKDVCIRKPDVEGTLTCSFPEGDVEIAVSERQEEREKEEGAGGVEEPSEEAVAEVKEDGR